MFDWQIFWTTFVTIFIAEMGDKTQIAAFAASSQTSSTVSVLLAVVLALACAGILGVAFGRVLGNLVNPAVMKLISGVLFIVLGAWVLIENWSVIRS